jgi:sulfotransferase family protein
VSADFPLWTDNAVLVYGPRKAGTTLFQNLLDGADELAVYPAELKLKYFAKHLTEPNLAAMYREQSRIPKTRSPHLSHERYAALWQKEQKGDLGTLIRSDILNLLASCDRPPGRPRAWIAKEVGGNTHAILRLWRKLFPRGRILFILRDPLMVTRAVLNDRRRKGRSLSALYVMGETLDPLRVIAAQERHLSEEDVFAIAYEDLVADPASTMRRVAAFLDVPFTHVLTRPTRFGEPIVVSTASRREKQVFNSAASWRDDLTPREQSIVAASSKLAHLIGLRVDYPQLRQQLASKPSAPSSEHHRA